mmetsp:Transcript_16375/g.62227  ORF Transcript_16375/g.62227 Transcript_16375/m.62227 type:complete len:211 (-) Transcript_16375:103-735(-)
MAPSWSAAVDTSRATPPCSVSVFLSSSISGFATLPSLLLLLPLLQLLSATEAAEGSFGAVAERACLRRSRSTAFLPLLSRPRPLSSARSSATFKRFKAKNAASCVLASAFWIAFVSSSASATCSTALFSPARIFSSIAAEAEAGSRSAVPGAEGGGSVSWELAPQGAFWSTCRALDRRFTSAAFFPFASKPSSSSSARISATFIFSGGRT